MVFDFLKYCLGNEVDMNELVAKMDWRELYDFAKKQALLGFCFQGIERLGNEYPKELRTNPIGQDLLMEWMGKAQQIRRRNMKVNVVAGKLYARLRNDGLRCCILKGQGNALMYPEPYYRTPGDIDVWVNAERAALTEYAKKHFVLGDDIRYHHLETTVDGVPVELHFMPGIMNNVVYNRRLQRWFKRNADLQCSNVVELPDGAGEIAVPTMVFNVIYQLCHLYHHFFDEGIGMRQVIDYYFVVNDFYKVKENFSKITPSLFTIKEGSTSHPDPLTLRGEGETAPTRRFEPLRSKVGGPSEVSPDYLCGVNRLACDTSDALETLQRELKHLGLFKFAGAVMYVLHEVFGLSENMMIAPKNEMEGIFLLDEIMRGGNFGQYDDRLGDKTDEGKVHRYFRMSLRNMRFVKHYPSEAICEPSFRTWFWAWKKLNVTK